MNIQGSLITGSLNNADETERRRESTLIEENSTARASETGVATRLVRVTGRVPELSTSRSIVRGPESEGTRPKFNIS